MNAPDPKKSLIVNSPLLANCVQMAYNHGHGATDDWISDQPFQCGDTQGRALVHRNKVGVLAIAGTNSVWDFSANLQTRITSLQSTYDLHSGFLKSAETALAAFLASGPVGECWESGNYFITGHSLGASTAAILPLLIARQSKLAQPVGVLSFASPYYTQGPGALLWPCPVLHVQSRLDLVSHIPNGLFGVRPWARAGQQVYIDDEGFDCYAGHEVTRMIGYAVRIMRLDFLRGKAKSIQEHSMSLYARRVHAGLIRLDNLTERLGNA